ncbi:MAG: hypothetical protein NXI01_08740 [Gammaproteobacteria bacterium]|nr:hypothetical protein [Gammaproteobacteria bacterium]
MNQFHHTNTYKLLGLSVSCDILLQAPDYGPISNCADVMIHKSNQKLLLPAPKNILTLNLDIPSVAQFQIQAGKKITYIPYDDATEDDLRLYLMGSCMGALLQQRGLIVLHGNAVTWDNQTCHIYMGNQGAGKSTTAAWHYQRGASIVADDICAILFNSKGCPFVIPSFPQLKLWQASADLLEISTASLKRVRAQNDKFMLPIASNRFAKEPCELKLIFEINQQEHTQKQIVGLEKLLKLQQHSYRYYFLSQMGLEYDYLKQLMTLASQVAVTQMPRINFEDTYVKQ